MSSKRYSRFPLAAVLALALAPLGAGAQETGKDPAATADPYADVRIDPQARKYLSAACEFLKSKPAFSVHGESSIEEIFRSGYRVQRSRGTTVVLKRPDRLWAEMDSDKGKRGIHYDGKSLVIHDVDAKVYGRMDAPGTVEAMLDAAQDRFDVTLPLADLVSDEPCAALQTSVTRAWYLGKHYFAGERLHHVFMVSPDIDLQVWITDGKQPVFRKMVLTYTTLPDEPQYGVVLTDWNFSPALGKAQFSFKPGADVQQIDFVTTEAAPSGDATAKE